MNVLPLFLGAVIPKYYYIPREYMEAERANPGSQKRVASSEGKDGNLFLWGQAVYVISQLMGKTTSRGSLPSQLLTVVPNNKHIVTLTCIMYRAGIIYPFLISILAFKIS